MCRLRVPHARQIPSGPFVFRDRFHVARRGTQCHKPIEGRLSKMECGLACGACADEIDREIQEP